MNKELLHRITDLSGLLFMYHVGVTQPQSYSGDISQLKKQLKVAFTIVGMSLPECEPDEILDIGLGTLKVKFPDASPFVDLGKTLTGLAMLKHDNAESATLDMIYNSLSDTLRMLMLENDVEVCLERIKILPPKDIVNEAHRLVDEKIEQSKAKKTHNYQNKTRSEKTYDVFISHASEDKDAIARPLYMALEEKGISVWFDEATLDLGDSLRRKIDEGLSLCRFGVVILSPQFLTKEWPQRELDGLVARETASGEKAILPIWHELDHAALLKYSPALADKLSARSEEGVFAITDKIIRVLNRSQTA